MEKSEDDRMEEKIDFVSALPPEMSMQVFAWVGPESLIRCEVVSWPWHNFLLHTEALWEGVLPPPSFYGVAMELNSSWLSFGGTGVHVVVWPS